MREVVLDTETTGLDPGAGHRVIEIGCVELMNHVPTGETYQVYINPERDIPAEAQAVHGITEEFLSDKPVFAEIAGELLAFLGDSILVIHNADFDLRFLNSELVRIDQPEIPRSRSVDTVSLARRKFPGAQANLDALCRRFQIDLSDRDLHGALKDSQLLAEVYLQLVGGRQPGLELASEAVSKSVITAQSVDRPPRPHAPAEEEAAAHAQFLARLENPIWLDRES